MCAAVSAYAQNSALAPQVRPTFFNASGTVAGNGFLCTTQTGTNTSLLTYQDSALTTPNQNPIRLNGVGRAVNGSNEVSIFIQAQQYRFSIYAAGNANTCNGNPVGALLNQIDNVYDLALLARASFATQLDDQTCHASQYTGSPNDAGGKIRACINALPATGGIVDVTGLLGPQTISITDPFVGVTKPIDLKCAAATYTVSVNSTIPSNIRLIAGQGCIFSVNSSLTLTVNSKMDGSSISQHFSGSGSVIISMNQIIYPQWWGAVGDGVTDDTASLKAAILAFETAGGTLLFPQGTYKITSTVTLTGSNIIMEGKGATILFAPSQPLSGTNGRFMFIAGNEPTTTSPIVGSIALGATSFTALNASDAAVLNPNDWITIWEVDTPRGDIVIYDQHQVASVSGTTVNLLLPIRTAFPGTHNAVQFKKITQLTHDVTVRDLTIHCVDPGGIIPVPGLVGITIAEGTRGAVIDNVSIIDEHGPAITAYRTGGYRVVNSYFRSSFSYAEFSSSVDSEISNNIFDSYNTSSPPPSAGLDFGFAFSTFSNNTLTRGGNYALIVWFGVHDSAINGNSFGWVKDIGAGRGNGITAIGAYNNTVANNVLIGGDGFNAVGSNIAIGFQTDTVASPNMISQGNRIGPNTINMVNGFGYSSLPEQVGSSFSAGDFYLDTTNNSTWTQPLLNMYTANISAGRTLQLTDKSNNNPFVQLISTSQTFNVNGSNTQFSIQNVTSGHIPLTINASTDALTAIGALQAPSLNYIATENGVNNAIACAASSGPTLTTGLTVWVKLAHTLQAGANTFAYNGGTALAIVSHRNTASNIGTGYTNGIIQLVYDGTQWEDLSQ